MIKRIVPIFLSILLLACSTSTQNQPQLQPQEIQEESNQQEETNQCQTENGETGFLMFDNNCYLPGENVMDTNCRVSEEGGCQSLDSIN